MKNSIDPNKEIDQLKLKILALPNTVSKQAFTGIEGDYWKLFNELRKPKYDKHVLRKELEEVAKLMTQTQKKIK